MDGFHILVTLLCLVTATEARWTRWSAWACSSECGSGVYYRTRKCLSASPCVGRWRQFTDADCYVKPCLRPTLPPDFAEQLEQSLRNQDVHQFTVKEGHPVNLECDRESLSLVRSMFPWAKIIWLRNDERVSYNRRVYVSARGSRLDIAAAVTVDSGVYICGVECYPRQIETLSVFSVAVVSDIPMATIMAGGELIVTCNGAPLARTFHNLEQHWKVNGTVIRKYNHTSPEEVAVDTFWNMPLSWSGVWQCVIKEPFTTREWVTNQFKVKVLPPPSKWRLLIDWPTVGFTISASVMALIIILCTFYIQKGPRTAEVIKSELEKMNPKVRTV